MLRSHIAMVAIRIENRMCPGLTDSEYPANSWFLLRFTVRRVDSEIQSPYDRNHKVCPNFV